MFGGLVDWFELELTALLIALLFIVVVLFAVCVVLGFFRMLAW